TIGLNHPGPHTLDARCRERPVERPRGVIRWLGRDRLIASIQTAEGGIWARGCCGLVSGGFCRGLLGGSIPAWPQDRGAPDDQDRDDQDGRDDPGRTAQPRASLVRFAIGHWSRLS